jgi:hypothetical protein
MLEVSATGAARNFFDLLDALEHRGEHFIVRRGKVAQLDPIQAGKGAEITALLQRHRPDSAFARDVTSARNLLENTHRP